MSSRHSEVLLTDERFQIELYSQKSSGSVAKKRIYKAVKKEKREQMLILETPPKNFEGRPKTPECSHKIRSLCLN